MKLYIDVFSNNAYASMKEALGHCPKHKIQEAFCNFQPNDGDTIYYSISNNYKVFNDGDVIYYPNNNCKVFQSEEEMKKEYPYNYPLKAVFVREQSDLTGKEFNVEIEQNEKGFYTVIDPNDNNRGKMFFLDKDYSGPCLPGKAKIKIVKDFTSYGFFTILELESYQMQDDTWFANYLADKFLKSNSVETGHDLFKYEGVRGSCYLTKYPYGGNAAYPFDAEDSNAIYSFGAEDKFQLVFEDQLDNKPVRLCSVEEFISRVCYERNDLRDIISEMKSSVAEKYAHSITWNLAMNSLDQMLYESSSDDVDIEFALESLFDARVIFPVRVEKAIAFKILKEKPLGLVHTDVFYEPLFQLKKVELDAAIEFVNAVNKIADERVAALIKARKIKV